jgi:hypothetical protein
MVASGPSVAPSPSVPRRFATGPRRRRSSPAGASKALGAAPTGCRNYLVDSRPVTALLNSRLLLAAVPGTAVAAVAVGVPTDVLPNPWFQRMTPVRTLDLVLWPLISIALGLLIATYVVAPHDARGAAQGTGGGLLGAFAVGCPICNKLVVAVLGVSGALTYFEPIQPVLGVAAITLAIVALRRRLAVVGGACAVNPHAAKADALPS